ncbi:hypothetical protein AAVH_11143 [Aphelenchoides avenae]|nr:hypothetical protein AAVH_11143 [Aphelenchus avenae]
MDAYDYYGVTYKPFTPWYQTTDAGRTQNGFGTSYQTDYISPYDYRRSQFGSMSAVSEVPMEESEFTKDFLWGMTFGTTVFMIVVCLALWCCLPIGLCSAAWCYMRNKNKKKV